MAGGGQPGTKMGRGQGSIRGDAPRCKATPLKEESLQVPLVIKSTHDFKTHSKWIQVTAWLFGPTALNEEISHFQKRKMFILVSTVMTWARSKPLDPVSSVLAFLLCNISPPIPCNLHARAFYSGWCILTLLNPTP